MKIAMNHGYLLTGTGSNLYVRNLVREFCAAGHDVFLLCQDSHPENIDFVAEVYEFDGTNESFEQVHRKDTPYPGTCKCFKPDLGGLLPVYVFDHYDGFEVKTFPDCTDQEIEEYVTRNVAALDKVVHTFGIDIIQTNHTVMLPYIVSRLTKRGSARHIATVHGSALNFTVKTDARFAGFAIAGLRSADEIFVDSKHAHEELLEFLDEHELPSLRARIRVIPPGVDVDNFTVCDGPRAAYVERFAASIGSVAEGSCGRGPATTREIVQRGVSGSTEELADFVARIRADYDYRFVDRDVVDRIRAIDFDAERVIIFVGKYLWTKGLHLLLLAIPLILRQHRDTRFVFVGFGPFREAAELILAAMARGELDDLARLAREGAAPFLSDASHGGSGGAIPLLAESLDAHGDRIRQALEEIGQGAQADDGDGTGLDLRDRVVFTGIVTHEHLGHLLPCADILVAASVFPEAFGMVAIEAMACGVYPILTYQSAFREITDELRDKLSGEQQVSGLSIRNVELDRDAVVNIAHNANSYLDVVDDHRRRGDSLAAVQSALRDVVVQSYSWRGVSKRFLDRYAHHIAAGGDDPRDLP